MNTNIDAIIQEELRRSISLSAEFHLCVVQALESLGFDATYEHPGYIAIHTQVFEIRIGQHAWSYCFIAVRWPDHCTTDEHFTFFSGETPEPILNDYETDPVLVARAWARAIRVWMEDQCVRKELIP